MPRTNMPRTKEPKYERAKIWLNRHVKESKNLESLYNRLEALEEKAYNPRSAAPNGMPHSGGDPVDTVGNTVARMEKLREKIEESRKKVNSLYDEIGGAIAQIDGSDWANQRSVLETRYLDLMEWEEVNSILFGRKKDFYDREDSYLRRTFYIHGKALEKLSAILEAQEAPQTATGAKEVNRQDEA